MYYSDVNIQACFCQAVLNTRAIMFPLVRMIAHSALHPAFGEDERNRPLLENATGNELPLSVILSCYYL
jgi:hypothetical protein